MASQEAMQTIMITTACLIEYDVNIWSDLHRIFKFAIKKCIYCQNSMRKWNINNLAEQTKFCQSMLPRKLKVMNRLSNFLLFITIFKTNIFKPNYLKWFRKKIAKTGLNNEDSLDAIPKWIDFFNCYNNLSRQLNVQGQFAQLKEELSV